MNARRREFVLRAESRLRSRRTGVGRERGLSRWRRPGGAGCESGAWRLAIERVGVVGSGLMGSGIAAVCATAGYRVVAYDVAPEALERARRRAERLGGEAAAARLHTTQDLSEAAVADLIIEAVPERLELKLDVFRQLDRLAPAHAILATNTSQLSVTAIAAATSRPGQVAGMHWFNPPERMQLVEVVRAVQTEESTLLAVRQVAERAGKQAVVVRDVQGFVTTRALSAFLLECLRILEEGVASPEDIDRAIRLGLNHPMGPLELCDYVGLDTILFVADSLEKALGERFKAPTTLRRLVEAGRLGRKSGHGFYPYPARG